MNRIKIKIEGKEHIAIEYKKDDYLLLQEIVKLVKEINSKLKTYFPGTKARKINLPETVSQTILCIEKSFYTIETIKGDCWDPISKEIVECKASSVKNDLSSFSPNTITGQKYFIDCHSLLETGNYTIYRLPDNLDDIKVNKLETFAMQKLKKRRPRFSIIKELINAKKYTEAIEGTLY